MQGDGSLPLKGFASSGLQQDQDRTAGNCHHSGAAISPVLPHYFVAYPPFCLDNCTHASLMVAYRLAAQRVTVSIPAWLANVMCLILQCLGDWTGDEAHTPLI